MRRTIAEVEAWLDTDSGLSEGERRAVAAEVQAARSTLTKFSNDVATDHATDVDERREDVLHELCEVRDSYAQLVKDGKGGKLTAAEFTERLNHLEGRQASAMNGVRICSEMTASVAAIEEDPLAYASNVGAYNIAVRHNFSF